MQYDYKLQVVLTVHFMCGIQRAIRLLMIVNYCLFYWQIMMAVPFKNTFKRPQGVIIYPFLYSSCH